MQFRKSPNYKDVCAKTRKKQTNKSKETITNKTSNQKIEGERETNMNCINVKGSPIKVDAQFNLIHHNYSVSNFISGIIAVDI